MRAYYNEIDPFVAAWLRELIAAGQLPAGIVDERSITAVRSADLAGYDQCHFFAGIGGWALALEYAEWPDDRPVWTGSCPCGPWSMAGAALGADDSRDLWPAWFRLWSECRPRVVFGEQVTGPAGRAWIDRVCLDVEAIGYAVGACDLPAASVGAPHKRQRYWLVADDDGARRQGVTPPRLHDDGASGHDALRRGTDDRLVHAERARLEGFAGDGDDGNEPRRIDARPARSITTASLTRAWSGVEPIACADGFTRPVKPGVFPLAHGVPGRVGRLRAYGNAIVPQVGAVVVASYLDAKGE